MMLHITEERLLELVDLPADELFAAIEEIKADPIQKTWVYDAEEAAAHDVAALTKMLVEERAKGMEEAGRCPQCEARESAFLESIRIKQECPHCGYQSIDWLGENAACPMLYCNGGMLTVPNRAAEVREKNDE